MHWPALCYANSHPQRIENYLAAVYEVLADGRRKKEKKLRESVSKVLQESRVKNLEESIEQAYQAARVSASSLSDS